MCSLLYNVFLHLVTVVLSPALFVLILLDKYNIRERLGFWKLPPGDRPEGVVWFHAASMGEVTALATVVDEVKKAHPQLRVAVSTTTISGQNRAMEFIPTAEFVFLAPLDLPWAIQRTLQRLHPSALIITETELWPNTIRMAKACGCRIALINGRMSDTSKTRYRMIKGCITSLLQRFDLLCVQTKIDRDHFIELGAHSEHVFILGNIKLDLLRFLAGQKKSELSKGSFGIPASSKVIVAGSTRPGEEAMLISNYTRIHEAEPATVFIIAPRHLDRLSEVEGLLTEQGLPVSRRTRIDGSTAIDSGILLLDTMGELSSIYSFADLAFVGGSLVPLGGHNPLEPAMWGIPVLFGPYRDNVRQLTDWLLQEQGGIEIRDGDDFTETVIRLLRNPDERKRRGTAALKVVQSKAGVSTRTVQLLQEVGIL